jgi:tetratricopeptide (TPR) repeat protein
MVLGVALLVSTARADSWISPEEHALESPNKRVKGTIKPADDGRSGASVTIGTRTFKLQSTWSPVDAVLFDDGTLLTFDNWHQLGHGTVAYLYERDGKVRWAKTLVELVGQPFIDTVSQSVSSIWWRRVPLEWTRAKDGKSGVITLADENHLQLSLRDGSTKIVAVAVPDEPPRLLNRARALARTPGQEADAILVLERAVAKDPELFEAVSLYIEVLQRTNEHARLVAGVERMAQHWKTKDGYNLANVYVALAKSYQALARPADAERVLRLAIGAAPVYPNPAIALAELLIDLNRRKDADIVIDAFTARLFKASHLDTYALSTVASFYVQRGDRKKALAQYLKAYRKDQVTNQFLYADLAKLYEAMNNDGDAIRINEQLLAHYVKLGSAFDMYAKDARAEIARLRAKKKPAGKPGP